MSNQSSTSFSSSSVSFSSSSNVNGQESGHSSTRQVRSGPDGTTVSTTSQNLGEESVKNTRNYDQQGRELLGSSTDSKQQIEDVSDEQQAKNDRDYEERMEEEYAKREGGA